MQTEDHQIIDRLLLSAPDPPQTWNGKQYPYWWRIGSAERWWAPNKEIARQWFSEDVERIANGEAVTLPWPDEVLSSLKVY